MIKKVTMQRGMSKEDSWPTYSTTGPTSERHIDLLARLLVDNS
jgi:hypothetical protein